MRFAITGVSGFIGSKVAIAAAESGHSVTGLVRDSSRRDHIEHSVDRFVVGNQDDRTCWPDLLDGVDCLIHNSVDWTPLRSEDFEGHLHSNLVGSIMLIDAAARRKPRPHVVFVSSVATLHHISDRWEGKIDEDHPLRPGGWYGAYKAAVEDHLWAAAMVHDMTFTIVRPCAVYGIDPNLERSIGYPFIEQLQTSARFERPGGGKFVHVDDVAHTIVSAAVHEQARNAVINLADCYARWADLATMLSERLGIDAQIDRSSPAQSRNVFSKDAARRLGVPLDRGHEGLRRYLAELVERVAGTS